LCKKDGRVAAGWRFPVCYLLGAALVLAPWLIRNRLVVGRFALTSETGFALGRAHNAFVFRYYPYRASIDVSFQEYIASLAPHQRQALEAVQADEFARGAWYQRQALD